MFNLKYQMLLVNDAAVNVKLSTIESYSGSGSQLYHLTIKFSITNSNSL
jgi:hypothetical protein